MPEQPAFTRLIFHDSIRSIVIAVSGSENQEPKSRLSFSSVLVAVRERLAFACVIHAKSVHDFTVCRSRVSADAGPGFHGMSVQRFTACRSSS